MRREASTSDYAALMSAVRGQGLLVRSARGYIPRTLVLGVLTAAGVVALWWAAGSWWELAVAGYFGAIFAQVGFLGHDAGHQQVFRTRRWNDLFGVLLSNLGIGLSYGWWVDKHNRHHWKPNENGADPDIDPNILSWTAEQAERQRGFLRVVARNQALLFFPLLLLEGWNLHVSSVRALFRPTKRRVVEALLLSAHVAGALTVLFVLLPPVEALLFIVVQQSVFGLYLGSTFAPNHKGMTIVEPDNDLDFLRRQVVTARNVRGGRALTWALGALNFQIEHHLFPSMPSRNLRRCRPIVREFCRAHGVAYAETSLLQSYRQALRYLHAIRPQADTTR